MLPVGARWHELFEAPAAPHEPALGALNVASGVLSRVLFSGQGMTNFIEIYKSGQKLPSWTALLDFGQGNSSQGDAVTKVCDTLAALQKAGRVPRIDLVIISHQDKDHWGLITGFLEEITRRKIALEVGQISFGGADWGNSAETAVGALAQYTPTKNAIPIPPNACDYNVPDGNKAELLNLGGVSFRVLACNISLDGVQTRSVTRNATSAVVVVDFNDYNVVFPGDATYQTMKFCNAKMAKWSISPVYPCLALGAPHHGALATFAQTYATKPDLTIGKAFAALVQPENVVASAGSMSHHHHPQLVVLDVFKQYTAKDAKHDIVAFNNAATVNAFQQLSRTESTYTTVIALPPNVKTDDYHFPIGTVPKTAVAAFAPAPHRIGRPPMDEAFLREVRAAVLAE